MLLTTLYLSLNERSCLSSRGTRGGLAPVRGRPDWLRRLETYRATSGYSWKATRVAPTPQGCMWTRLGARHRGHLLFAARCMAASQPRQTACGQCQRHGGARDCGSCVGHGELNLSVHTQHSSPAHSGAGGAAGTHPRGRPPGRGIEPKAASAVARSPKVWRRCSSNPATHTCSR